MKELIASYIFEVVERVYRFHYHLSKVEEQFYEGGTDVVGRYGDKRIFISSYRDCLFAYLQILAKIAELNAGPAGTKGSGAEDKIIKILDKIIADLGSLHKEWLNHLPRPSEPIELKRFARIINKQILTLYSSLQSVSLASNISTPNISIYVSENIGEETYNTNPLQSFKEGVVAQTTRDAIASLSLSQIADSSESNKIEPYHITIPRIDSENPCRWSSLMHEVAHKIMQAPGLFETQPIREQFDASLDQSEKQCLGEILSSRQDIDFSSWLTECWCDAIACLAMGPSFWFSQYISFTFSRTNVQPSVSHPPALFRLFLLKRILEHRFGRMMFPPLMESLEHCFELVELWDRKSVDGFTRQHEIQQLYIFTKHFFFQHLFEAHDRTQPQAIPNINPKLKELCKWMSKIDQGTLESLISSLRLHLPIPSKLKQDVSTYQEEPSFVQEILLAAWLYRTSELKKEIISGVTGISRADSLEEIKKGFEEQVCETFRRFDEAVLYSIQVSEWFDALMEPQNERVNESPSSALEHKDATNDTLLVDCEIKRLIVAGSLKVIPIISLRDQLGASSLDVRFGTSYQLYYPNQHGIIDFVRAETLESTGISSRMISLDFGDSVVISPRQFILGHSMEYIKLPDNIAAQVEGRSSFARLGLEIHMTAGFIDPGFEGVLTYEIFNAGPNPIRLFPGLRIAQIRLFRVTQPDKAYRTKAGAKYRGYLVYQNSMQFQDSEIRKLRQAFEKRGGEPSK